MEWFGECRGGERANLGAEVVRWLLTTWIRNWYHSRSAQTDPERGDLYYIGLRMSDGERRV